MTLEEAVGALMGRQRVLVGVDFDGTLAPLVEHPDDAKPDREAIGLLSELAGLEGVAVAVVSGRSLSDLRRRLGDLPGALLIGEHGNDTGEETEASEALVAAKRMIEEVRADIGPVTVEEKQRSVTMHTRGLDEDVENDVIRRLRTFALGQDEVQIIEGKKVIELTTARKTKGIAIGEIAATLDAVLFLGDDTTDETVFESLGANDVGVKVGEGPTAAQYRVDDVAGAVSVLSTALACRRASSWHD